MLLSAAMRAWRGESIRFDGRVQIGRDVFNGTYGTYPTDIWIKFYNMCPGLEIELKNHGQKSGRFEDLRGHFGNDACKMRCGDSCAVKVNPTRFATRATISSLASPWTGAALSSLQQQTFVSMECTIAEKAYVVVVAQTSYFGGFEKNRCGIQIRAGVAARRSERDQLNRGHGINASGDVDSIGDACKHEHAGGAAGDEDQFFESAPLFRVFMKFCDGYKANYYVVFAESDAVLTQTIEQLDGLQPNGPPRCTSEAQARAATAATSTTATTTAATATAAASSAP